MIYVTVLSPTPALRAGLRALLSGDPEVSLTTGASLSSSANLLARGIASDIEELPAAASDLPAGNQPLAKASVIVATPGGVDLASPLLDAGQALLLVTDDPQEVRALAELGLRAWGVLSSESTAEALQAAVRALAEGLVVASPEALRQALANPGLGAAMDGEDDGPADPLTERESSVLLRLAQGLTNKQIALALGISEHTVKFHVSSIYTKLGVSNRTEAVRKGARRGWVPL